jgi:hypothetical protein
MTQVHQLGYRAFLQYSCPGYDSSGAMVPPGDNLDACPRPILGVYE